ncbi:MAG: TraB family protein, partial [Methanomicrobiales archaeon]|nr:TraB family protein [Methanomicrobiales archaeon]
ITAVLYWVLIHGVLTALFTLAAGGHPLSALTGFAVSWFTALHPLLAAGWFSAIVEAKIRNPSTKDFRGIMEAGSFTELRKNALFRVILVAALANVGSTLGTVIYFFFVFNGLDMGTVIATGFGNMWHAIATVFGI